MTTCKALGVVKAEVDKEPVLGGSWDLVSKAP